MTDGDKYYWKWSPVRRNVLTDFYPENSLEIQTSSTFTPVPGGKDYIKVGFYDSEDFLVGLISINFYENSKSYGVTLDQEYTEYPVESPSTGDKIWRITVKKVPYNSYDKIIIQCNGKEVLYIFNRYYESHRFRIWRIDDITQLKFASQDRASNKYRFFKGK
jgi:hypothetical protein